MHASRCESRPQLFLPKNRTGLCQRRNPLDGFAWGSDKEGDTLYTFVQRRHGFTLVGEDTGPVPEEETPVTKQTVLVILGYRNQACDVKHHRLVAGCVEQVLEGCVASIKIAH